MNKDSEDFCKCDGYNQSQEEQGEVEVVIDVGKVASKINKYFGVEKDTEVGVTLTYNIVYKLAQALSDNLPSILKVKR